MFIVWAKVDKSTSAWRHAGKYAWQLCEMSKFESNLRL